MYTPGIVEELRMMESAKGLGTITLHIGPRVVVALTDLWRRGCLAHLVTKFYLTYCFSSLLVGK